MMLIEQQRDLGRQMIRISGEKHISEKTDFREQMLLHNEIEGVVPFTVQREDGKNIYEYAVSGREALSQYCENNRLGTDFLRLLLCGVLRTIYRGREFMLSEQDYVIRPDTVFLDDGGNPGVPYFPGYAKNLRIQLRELAEYLMDNIDYNDNDAVLLTYGFYMKAKDDSCSIEGLMDVVAPAGKCVNAGDNAHYPGLNISAETLSERDKSKERDILKNRDKLTERVGKNDSNRVNEPDMVNERGSKCETGTAENKNRAREQGQAKERNRSKDKAVTDNYLRNSDETEMPGAWEIYLASSGKLKMISVFIPFVIFLIELSVFKYGAATDPVTGEKDFIKGLGLIALGAAAVWAAEKKIWTDFAKSVTESFRSAAESEEDCTVLLCNDGISKYPFQLLSDEYPSICAGRFPFYVGKDPETSDYVLNKTGVSRYHMKVEKEGEIFYISDLSSTNGTYLNGVRLKPYERSAVRRGDEIRIAACTFYCN